jgi:small-conductance mechanosensitive channel
MGSAANARNLRSRFSITPLEFNESSRMEQIERILLRNPRELATPLIVFVLTMSAGYVFWRILRRTLKAWTSRTGSRPGMILTQALTGPVLIWTLILAAHLAIQASALPERATRWSGRVFLVLWILSLTIMCMRLAGDLVRYYGGGVRGALPVATLTQNLAQLAVAILGMLVLLTQLGLQIAPILTALGVGGLAVALALQDTLSNLFAGFYMAWAGQIRLGDYIKLNTGEEGYIADISWRSTSIRPLNNNLIIVPNSKLAQAVVTNYHLPDMRMSASLQVRASYECDPDRVERILLEVALEGAREIPEMLAEPAPSVDFDPGFGEFALAFTVNFSVTEFAKQFPVRNELRRRILRRFREEKVGMPFPARDVYFHAADRAATDQR